MSQQTGEWQCASPCPGRPDDGLGRVYDASAPELRGSLRFVYYLNDVRPSNSSALAWQMSLRVQLDRRRAGDRPLSHFMAMNPVHAESYVFGTTVPVLLRSATLATFTGTFPVGGTLLPTYTLFHVHPRPLEYAYLFLAPAPSLGLDAWALPRGQECLPVPLLPNAANVSDHASMEAFLAEPGRGKVLCRARPRLWRNAADGEWYDRASDVACAARSFAAGDPFTSVSGYGHASAEEDAVVRIHHMWFVAYESDDGRSWYHRRRFAARAETTDGAGGACTPDVARVAAERSSVHAGAVAAAAVATVVAAHATPRPYLI